MVGRWSFLQLLYNLWPIFTVSRMWIEGFIYSMGYPGEHGVRVDLRYGRDYSVWFRISIVCTGYTLTVVLCVLLLRVVWDF